MLIAFQRLACWIAVLSTTLGAGVPRAAADLFEISRVAINGDRVVVDDGAEQSPVEHPTQVVQMPVVAESASLEAAGVQTSNLGAFTISIVPGATLAGNAAALAAFNRAADQWEAMIADPITVTINADLAPLGPGILGSASSVILQNSFNAIRNAVVNDAADEPDDLVASQIPMAAGFTAFLPGGFNLNGLALATKANLKALGVSGLDTTFGASDASITFSSNFAFDFDNSNGVTGTQFDFEGVAAHEIGHALGFFSIVDTIDTLINNGQTSSNIQPNTLDFFRFDDDVLNDPQTLVDFGVKPRSLVPGNVEHFDQISNLSGGDTEVLMSTGLTQGDGRQASHWKDSQTLGLMDPTLGPGELGILRPNDFRAIDLIGYEINVVPEGSSFGLLLLSAVLGLGGWKLAAIRRASNL